MNIKNIGIYEVSTDCLSCEPLIERAPNGDLVCVCQQGGMEEPSPKNREYVFLSKDNGKTWSERKSIYPEDGNAVYGTELAVIGDEITAYIVVHSGGFLDCKAIMMKSFDNGNTWVNCGAPPYFSDYVFMRGAMTTRKGEIIMPYHWFPITKEEHDRVLKDTEDITKHIAHTKTETCETGVLKSCDNGKTYQKYTSCVIDMTKYGWTWTEPTIAELSDGSISMLMRHECSGWLYRCDSKDGGKNWGEFYKTDIPNPTNKPRLFNLEHGNIALVHTPNCNIDETGYGKRNPYELWISNDDMKTWYKKIRLTDFPGEYHYTDGFYEDGHLYFVVEHNRHTILFFDVEFEC